MANKKATIYDVAKLACVSLATASRVINGVDNVALDTKQRVLDAIKQLNYKPSVIAKELASKKTTSVAIIVPELNYTYISHVVSGLMQEATEMGYECLIFTTKNSKNDVSTVVSKVLSRRVNGIVFFNDSLSEEELNDLINFDIPIVSLGVENKKISSVSWHYKNQIVDLVNEALSRDKQICFIKVSDSSKMEERILKGVRHAYFENASYFDNVLEVKDSYNATYELIKEKLPTMKNSLFIATRDSIALAALNAALDLNYKVPEDFEFMAMIGTKYSELTRPKLSSFNIDMRGLGKEGMRVLSELILDNGKIIQKKLPFVFVKRGSTL